MKFDFKNCSEEALWKYVASHLNKKGIDTVLVGGAVVSIYTKGAYKSGDLDFITTNLFVDDLPEAMAEIGFKKTSKRHYEHPECPHLFVEFPPGPIGIGEELNIEPDVMNVKGAAIKILSPTDSVKDRLASYIHFQDRDGLDQALLIAKSQPIKLDAVLKWCEREGAIDAFEEFKQGLEPYSK
ncbi:MAG: nucleotidyltransferase [Bdellovibrionales bacterium]